MQKWRSLRYFCLEQNYQSYFGACQVFTMNVSNRIAQYTHFVLVKYTNEVNKTK